ncbi:MAG: pyridoxamine 5'-phosphate oxidase family protein [Acidimicrobiales bacterium]
MPSRRDLIKMPDEEMDAFLHERHTMNVATINHDGTIHLVAMWYGFLDGDPAFWTYGKSQKILNLQRDSRVTCLVEAGERYEALRGVELVGKGEVLTSRDQILAVGASVYERYFGPVTEETAPVLEVVGAKRLAVRVHVDRIVSWDHAKLGGTY